MFSALTLSIGERMPCYRSTLFEAGNIEGLYRISDLYLKGELAPRLIVDPYFLTQQDQ